MSLNLISLCWQCCQPCIFFSNGTLSDYQILNNSVANLATLLLKLAIFNTYLAIKDSPFLQCTQGFSYLLCMPQRQTHLILTLGEIGCQRHIYCCLVIIFQCLVSSDYCWHHCLLSPSDVNIICKAENSLLQL